MDALGSNLIQFALLEDVNYAAVQKKYDVNLIAKKEGLSIIVNKYADKKLIKVIKKASLKLGFE
ncbi:MAG: hypothetical protein HY776_07980 [Actinobacteria bacterium]|nr:hypothetical protein [Actinomycetota bacterium]